MLQRSIVQCSIVQCSMVALSILEGMGVGEGRALRGALASGGLATKIFLYNKLPT